MPDERISVARPIEKSLPELEGGSPSVRPLHCRKTERFPRREFTFAQAPLKPHDIVPLSKFIADSGVDPDRHETHRLMEPHAGRVGYAHAGQCAIEALDAESLQSAV